MVLDMRRDVHRTTGHSVDNILGERVPYDLDGEIKGTYHWAILRALESSCEVDARVMKSR
jgi:hypothetical protein